MPAGKANVLNQYFRFLQIESHTLDGGKTLLSIVYKHAKFFPMYTITVIHSNRLMLTNFAKKFPLKSTSGVILPANIV